MAQPLVSILMLTFNAPDYVEQAVRSVRAKTDGVDYRLVVLDNSSDDPTRELLRTLKAEGMIDVLELLDRNSLFAEGNNIAARLAPADSTHFVLLNSDVEIRSSNWLSHLLNSHRRGITAFGIASDPLRVDGYCLLIDSDLYRDHQLDEGHQWWWGVTKLQAKILCHGHSVRGYEEHEEYVHHFGGKSGSAFGNAKGMNVTAAEVMGWFDGAEPTVLDWAAADRAKHALRRRLRKTRRKLSS